MFKFRKSKRKVFVLSLDGVPFSFLEKEFKSDTMPYFSSIVRGGGVFQRINSIIPPISSVAWSSFMTGKNPAKHGIFGFVDRIPSPFEMFIPTALNMKSKTLWEIISDDGKRVIVLNVPLTYPPKKVNGTLVSGFLATNIEKAVYPEQFSKYLRDMGYIIDVDPWKAKDKKEEFMQDIYKALEKRKELFLYLINDKDIKWDFFMLHIMETDRINHFLFDEWENNGKKKTDFLNFYNKIDEVIYTVHSNLPKDTIFMMLSDHGFCGIKKEVFLNHWLCEKGYLKLNKTPPEGLRDISPSSRAYSLIPGRIFINLQGRESIGSVPSHKYEGLVEKLKGELLDIRDPETNERLVERVLKRDEIYTGAFVEDACDLIVLPKYGYDIKGNLYSESFTGRSHLVGMHTYDDAFLYVKEGRLLHNDNLSILDIAPSILNIMGIDVNEDMDGRVIFAV